MSLTYEEQLQQRQDAMQAYKTAIEKIAPRLLAACVPENRRNASVEAFNMPPELNSEIYAIYDRFASRQQQGSRTSWVDGLGMTNTSDYLEGYSIGYAGRNADKFYLCRFTQEQHNQILSALGKAAAEWENA